MQTLHVILICKSLHVRRSPWISFPSPHRAKLASTCVRHARRKGSPVPSSLKSRCFGAPARIARAGRCHGHSARQAAGSFRCSWTGARRSRGYRRIENEQPVDVPHADLQPRSTPRRHHAQRFHHRNRRSAAVPALADVPFTSELYDRAFADFAMSNLGVSIAANASNQTKPEGK